MRKQLVTAYMLTRKSRREEYCPECGQRKYCTVLHSEKGKEHGKELWANPYLKEYEKKHGMHFSEKMAEHASKKMKNRNGLAHYWTRDEVKNAIMSLGIKHPQDVRWCDLQYLANMAYADYFGSSLKTEADCLQWACDYIYDPDGYDGKAFNHYLADLMECEHCDIPWQEVM